MTEGRFSSWRREGFTKGQCRLADTIRVLVYKADARLFELLDYEDDDSFLDPSLFAYFTDLAPAVKLPQLLAARILPRNHQAQISVQTDAEGRITLPGLGELETGLPQTTVELGWDVVSAEPRCFLGEGNVSTRLLRSCQIGGTNVEVVNYRQPLFDRFFVEAGGTFDTVELAATTRRYHQHVFKAFDLLRLHCPALAEEIMAATRQVVLYRGELPNSFATLSAHGAIFLNVNGAVDEIFFIEDITHQAGHVLFNALTLAKERFLRIDSDTSLAVPHSNDRESRTVYAAFHGIFTYLTISEALTALLERGVLDARQAHEAIGRLGLVLCKFAVDLGLLDRDEFWTPLGRRCWRYFKGINAELNARYGSRTRGFSYCNQPYVFDYERFAELNPPGSSSSSRRGA